MERCAVCGAEEFIPYVCRYCGRVHCVYHRLPENHECPNIQQARAPKLPIRVERRSSGTNLRLIRAPKLSSLPNRELYALSTALLVLGLSFSTRYIFSGLAVARPAAFLEVFLLTLMVIGTGFVGHELSHKFVAQRYGCWAEFKLWTVGAVMAVLFAFIPPGNLVFAAPGAVYIASRSSYFGEGMDRKANGIISLVGPLVNIGAAGLFGLAFLASSLAGFGDIVVSSGSGLAFKFLQEGVAINLWLGAFNLIPFFILDGQKIFTWDRKVWAAVAIPVWVATIAVWVLPFV
jgi:Zn-dependent protease